MALNVPTSGKAKDVLPVATRIHRELKKRIAEGLYAPDSYLPAERDLAVELETSRVTISKVLDRLAHEGFLTRAQGRGTRVLAADSTAPIIDAPVIGILHADHIAEHFSVTNNPSYLLGSLTTLRGAIDTLERLNCRVRPVSLARWRSEDQPRLIEQFGGIIVIEEFDDVVIADELAKVSVPLVIAKSEHDTEVHGTWIDIRKPMCEAVRILARFGHERIAFVGREPQYGFYGRAREGYLAGLKEVGLPVNESWMGICAKTDALSGYRAARTLLSLPERPTAVVAARDTIAEGICVAAEEAKLLIGRDLSVIGFDDITWPEGRNSLTTFREPCYEMGVAAAELVCELMNHRQHSIVRRLLDTPFVLRRSVGPHFPGD